MVTPSGSFSFGSSKSKTTANETYNKTGSTRVQLPDWALQPGQRLMGGVENLMGYDPSSLVPDDSPYQTTALNRVNGLSGQPDAFEQAAGWTRGAATAGAPQMKAASILDGGGISAYYNPFDESVVQGSLADFDFNAGQDRARETLAMAGNGAFGGSGAALTRSAGDDARARARFSLGSGIRQQGWNTAASLAGQDADRRQNASMANATFTGQQLDRSMQGSRDLINNATTFDANTRANQQQVFDQGTQLRTQDQERRTAPFDMQKYLTDLWSSVANPFFGQDVTEAGTSTGTTTQKAKKTGFTLGFGS